MKKFSLTLLFVPLVLGACQDYALNRQQMDAELRYICSAAINTQIGSVEYSTCRQFYDKVLLQYDVNVSKPWSFDVSTLADRSRPLANRCRSYSSNSATILNCLQEQENIMLAEHIRKKLLREEQEAQKELIRTKEHERAHREKEIIKEREKQKARYNPAPKSGPHEDSHSFRSKNDRDARVDDRKTKKNNHHDKKNEKTNRNEDFNQKESDMPQKSQQHQPK